MSEPRDALSVFVSKTPLGQGLSREELSALLHYLDIRTYQEGDCVVEEGDGGDAWYLVLQGALSVTKRMENAPPHTLAELDPGECFGEMALLDGAPRLASVHALEECKLARLDAGDFRRLLRENHPAAVKVLWATAAVLCRRQRELTYILTDLVEVDQPHESATRQVLVRLLQDG